MGDAPDRDRRVRAPICISPAPRAANSPTPVGAAVERFGRFFLSFLIIFVFVCVFVFVFVARRRNVPDAFELGMDELAAMPTITFPCLVVCAGNRRKEQNMIKKSIGFNWGPSAVGNTYWKGVPLRLLLNRAGIHAPGPGARFVCLAGPEGELPKSYDGQDGCMGDFFYYEDAGYCDCPTDSCQAGYDTGAAGGSGQLYTILHSTMSPSVTPSPTPLTCGVVYEDADDASIGEGWSDTGITYASGYGYIHGSCESHDNYYYSSGYYSSGNCVDTANGAEDDYGDGCEWYDSNSWGCGGYDDSDFDSNSMCCACGGGFGSSDANNIETFCKYLNLFVPWGEPW